MVRTVKIGEKYGRLTIISFAHKSAPQAKKIICLCDCGNEFATRATNLITGNTSSCGCLKKEMRINANTTHNLTNHPLYSKWTGMIGRCKNPNGDFYKDYGGRGIKVSAEWRNNFKAFYDWSIANGWEKGLSIERNDVNGDYSPQNCSWILLKDQSLNTRRNIRITYNGVTMAASRWADELGIIRSTFYNCLREGKTMDQIMRKRGKVYGPQFAFGHIK